MNPTLMYQEAAAAADAVRGQAAMHDLIEAAAARLRALDPPLVLTCGRGSSDHAATFAQYLVATQLGLPCYSHPPSLGSVLHATSRRLAGAVMILVSQSGRSPDLLRSAEAARAAGMTLIGLVNDASSPLADMVDILLPVGAGVERSVAATKSVIATMAMMIRLAAAWARSGTMIEAIAALPDQLDRAWQADWSTAIAPIATVDHLFVLGRDLTLGVAQEAALKFKETCSLHAEAFSLAEVAHGPMAIIGPSVPVLAFPSEAAIASGAVELLGQFRDRGATVVMAGHPIDGSIALPLAATAPVTRPLLVLQGFYRLAEAVARARGHDPDRPPSLAKVTRTL